MSAHHFAEPATYRVDVAGHLDDRWSDWLGGHPLVRNRDASTSLSVRAVDQAQLHGVLAGVRDLGLTLLSVRTVDTDVPSADVPSADAPVLARPLHTERLTLRAAIAQDADVTWCYRRLDSVQEWLSGAPATVEEYRSLFADPTRLAATVVVELGHGAGTVIGDFMLRREDAWAQAPMTEAARDAQAELGWVLDPAYVGAGYATEAVAELLRHCFEDLGVHRVVADCFLDNDASWRLMERVGMRRETHALRESLHRSGRWLDTVGYALLADEWKRAR
jgi:RimJ/RimL family protein N-acetyltransferase